MAANNIFFEIIILAVATLVVGVVLAANGGKYANVGKALIMIVASAVVLFAYLFTFVIIAFSTTHVALFSILAAVIALCLLMVLAAILWRRKGIFRHKWLGAGFAGLAIVCVLIGCCHNWYESYVENELTLSEPEQLIYQYAPYAENTLVAELDDEAMLSFDGDFPRLDGATAMYPLYSAFAKALYPRYAVDPKVNDPDSYNLTTQYLKCSTTTDAYRKIVDGEADIIFVGGPSEAQEEYAKSKGVELVYTPIGREAFAFFVNSKNPLDDISVSQIKGIYSGEITKWNALDVNGLGDIKAFQRDEGSGSQTALQRFVMKDTPLAEPPVKDVITGMGGIISQTADYVNHKNAIGFSFRFYSTQMVKNDKIKLLSINGVYPDLESIENGSYPYASEFYAVTRSDASENTKKLVEWVCTTQGQSLVEKTGYVPLYK